MRKKRWSSRVYITRLFDSVIDDVARSSLNPRWGPVHKAIVRLGAAECCPASLSQLGRTATPRTSRNLSSVFFVELLRPHRLCEHEPVSV